MFLIPLARAALSVFGLGKKGQKKTTKQNKNGKKKQNYYGKKRHSKKSYFTKW